jgi:metal-responsive CopG/Arc/MetJ family transcriptional regulator
VKKAIYDSKAIPVKIDAELLARIDAVAQTLKEPRSTIMRLAIRLGIEPLEALVNRKGSLGQLIDLAAAKEANKKKPAA